MSTFASETVFNPSAVKLNVAEAELQSWPLPDHLVLAGRPQASGCILSQSADGRVVRGVWACTPGTFRWDWTCDETVTVVAGRATVSVGEGQPIELTPGDMAFFEAGQSSTWMIHEPFRKAFHTFEAQRA
jgi:uncharacterized cupin superfamily protein